jgi:hypothetical protein
VTFDSYYEEDELYSPSDRAIINMVKADQVDLAYREKDLAA